MQPRGGSTDDHWPLTCAQPTCEVVASDTCLIWYLKHNSLMCADLMQNPVSNCDAISTSHYRQNVPAAKSAYNCTCCSAIWPVARLQSIQATVSAISASDPVCIISLESNQTAHHGYLLIANPTSMFILKCVSIPCHSMVPWKVLEIMSW